MMNVPENLEVPEDATQEFAESVRDVNDFLNEARQRIDKMEREVGRLGKIRGTIPIHNGPSGVVFLE
jgi:hypothetical protein